MQVSLRSRKSGRLCPKHPTNTRVISLEISRAKAPAKFPGSGAAQEAAREKMGLKSRQNRVSSFFLDFLLARIRGSRRRANCLASRSHDCCLRTPDSEPRTPNPER